MKMMILARDGAGVEREAVVAHVERRMDFALTRLKDALSVVRVTVGDVNGPRGGVDKRCRVLARGAGVGEVVVEIVDADWRSAVDKACEVTARCVTRALTRARRARLERVFVRGSVREVA